jgi:hypothetical protein
LLWHKGTTKKRKKGRKREIMRGGNRRFPVGSENAKGIKK